MRSVKSIPLRRLAVSILKKIKEGELLVVSNTEVLQEILHRYFSIRMPDLAEAALEALKAFCREIYPIRLSEIEKAYGLLKEFPSINARDAVHAATMLNNSIEKILSVDPHFDAIRGIKRISP